MEFTIAYLVEDETCPGGFTVPQIGIASSADNIKQIGKEWRERNGGRKATLASLDPAILVKDGRMFFKYKGFSFPVRNRRLSNTITFWSIDGSNWNRNIFVAIEEFIESHMLLFAPHPLEGEVGE